MQPFVLVVRKFPERYSARVTRKLIALADVRAAAKNGKARRLRVAAGLTLSEVASEVGVGVSLRSGVRDSILCPDRTPRGGTFRVLGGIDVVNTGNANAALDDPRCADIQAAIAWAGG
jgi:hypothetical protein